MESHASIGPTLAAAGEAGAGHDARRSADGRPTTGQLVAFTLPGMVGTAMLGPMTGVVPALYAERYSIDMAAIGIVLLISRVFDAVIDPAIGYLSDATRSRWGKRKPWIAAGALLATLSLHQLYAPGDQGGTAYFLAWSLVIYFAWSLSEIPYTAWSLELCRDERERTRIFSYRTFAIYGGGIFIAILPQLVPDSQGRMDFAALELLSWVIVVTLPLGTLAALMLTPRGEVSAGDTPRLRDLWPAVRGNRPFQSILAMYLCIGLAGGINGGLAFVYLNNYLDLGQSYTAITLPALLIGPAMTPVWARILRRFELQRAATVAFGIYLVAMLAAFLIEPGPRALTLYIANTLVIVGLYPALQIAMPTILGSAIDYDELRTGKNRGGQYYSLLVLVQKGNMALGTPLGFLVVGVFGYQVGAAANGELATLGLRIGYAVIPALLVAPALWLLWTFPLDQRRQQIIRRRLHARAARRAAATPGVSS